MDCRREKHDGEKSKGREGELHGEEHERVI